MMLSFLKQLDVFTSQWDTSNFMKNLTHMRHRESQEIYALKMCINQKGIALYLYCTERAHDFKAPCGESFCKMKFQGLRHLVLKNKFLQINWFHFISRPPPTARAHFYVQMNFS